MGLLGLSLRDFRCFAVAELTLSRRYNLIVGENASGKTSLLEAAFLLSRGRSFRASRMASLVRTGSGGFRVAGGVEGPFGLTHLGVGREGGLLRARVGGRNARGLAELAQTLPLQLVDSEAYLLISGGPERRRQFLDWGVFHVEPEFFPAWRRYHRALRQRNALLRRAGSDGEIGSWNEELDANGQVLDRSRTDYLNTFVSSAAEWSGRALGGLAVDLDYRRGWPEGQSLSKTLAESLQRDRQQGATQAGPHRADLVLRVSGWPAQGRVSRGQEKALAGALYLAQMATYRAATGMACTLLLDDLSAELDKGHLERFLELVDDSGAQVLITAIEAPPALQRRADVMFHVKQGEISRVV